MIYEPLIKGPHHLRLMNKAIAVCLTALLLLAGCTSLGDSDLISIVGCDDESALNYEENVTESGLCASEDDLEAGITSFINLMDEGPDMDNITSTIGYSMEVSSAMGDETWHYMETMVVSPDGMKVTIEDNYGQETLISDMIVSGSEVQYSFNNGTSDFQVRMSHEGTTLEAFDAMMNMGNAMDMGDDMDSGDVFVCDNGEEISADWVNDGMYDCEDRSDEDNEIDMFVCDNGEEISADWVNDGEEDCDDGSDESDNDGTEGRQIDMNMGMDEDEDENPESGDYTEYFNPVTATFSGFEVTTEGMVFSGLLNVEGAPFGALEVYTTYDFTVTGFSMMNVNDENNWVKFVLINSGETVVDNTLPLSALPFILMDPSLFGDDGGEDMDADMVCYNFETDEVVDIYDETDCFDAGAEYMWTNMDRDDLDAHDEDREEDMVCYDDYNHVILEDYNNQMDCEFSSYVWVSADSVDGHTGENSWTFEREMEDCDSDNDTMVSYEELVACINTDLANDGFGDMSASDVGAGQMFDMSDMDNDTFLNESEFNYLNSMYPSDEDNHHDGRAEYVCVKFIEQSALAAIDDFSSVYNNSNLDDSLCGTPANDVDYTFDNSTFNLPLMMVYEECWTDENNTTMCDYGTIEVVNGSELWDHFTAEGEYDCDGELDNETYMCLEYMGKIDDSDANAFTVYNENSPEITVWYQYDAESGSGQLMITEDRHGGDDASPDDLFAMLDADGDGELTVSEWYDSSHDSEEPMDEEDFEALKALMRMYDDDSSEGLNMAEFENMSYYMDGNGNNEDPELIFRMIDSNHDGEVTASEWADSSNQSEDEDSMSDEDYQNLAMMIDMYDDDSSGGLNYTEFETMMEGMDDGEDGMEDMQMVMVMTMVNLHGDLDDYSVTLAYCDEDMACGDDVYSVKLSDITVTEDTFFFSGYSVMFMDMDESGTLNSGDAIMIDTSSLEVDGPWNTPRLHSEEADSYADENPMPGFTGIFATIGLLGAALIRRE